jgi:hypothetical protein
MKHLFTILTALIFLSSSLYSQALEELEKQIASKNHIKTACRFDYKYITGKVEKKGIKTSESAYNQSGDKLKIDYLNDKGMVTATETYSYDNNGNRTLFEQTGSSKYRKESKYNSQNKVIHESGFNGTEEFANDYRYSADGKLIEITYSASGRIQQKLVYTHNGLTANVDIYARGSTLSSKMKMTYDSKGNLISETSLSLDNRELEKKEYTYNASSQILTETKKVGGALYYRISFVYNSGGSLLSVSEETLAKKKYVKKEYVYDAMGNLTTYRWRRNPDEEFNIKTYTYDPKGICLTENTRYPKTNFELLSKYEYTFY